MISFKNIIAPIVSDLDANMYVVGLGIKNGIIIKIKIYNKIFIHTTINDNFIYNFAGKDCYNYYKTTNEWKKFYPGFSGFTVGAECSLRNNEIININYGYGFKDLLDNKLIFNAYYINNNKKIHKNEIYDYIKSESLINFNNKLNTEFIEIKRNNKNSYCFCPKIDLKNTDHLESMIFNAISIENKNIINKIKSISDEFLIVNYGICPEYEKIYIISKNKNDIQEIYSLIFGLMSEKNDP